jgi:molybdopterin synthase catalytic subunit
LIELTKDPISPERIINSLAKDGLGAYITFIGTVRNTSQEGNKVTHLLIEPCGEDAEIKLRDIATEISEQWGIQDIAISRRTGKLKVGEIALVLVVAAAHRQEAFEACQYAVDRIKQGHITTEKDLYEPD